MGGFLPGGADEPDALARQTQQRSVRSGLGVRIPAGMRRGFAYPAAPSVVEGRLSVLSIAFRRS